MAGDAILTDLLREVGVTDAELAADGGTRAEAVGLLHAVMLRVPQDRRITILSRTGVGRWANSEVWADVAVAGREFVFTIDGAPATDWAAWNALIDFWDFAASRTAKASFLDLGTWQDHSVQQLPGTGPGADAGGGTIGLEDFFARGGSCDKLLSRRRSELPVRPVQNRDDMEIGAWRVSADGNAVEQFVREEGVPSSWKTMIRIGGRVASVETHRAPTSAERRTGVFGAKDAPVDGDTETDDDEKTSICLIEVQWLDEDANEVRAVVSGPSIILMNPPREWAYRGAHIPDDLLLHPEWPPVGMSWLEAVKRNTAIPSTGTVRWTTMGWVPVDGSSVCSFISGGTVISLNDEGRIRTLPGVTNRVLPGSSGFGLPALETEVMSAAWKTQVRLDLSELRHTFIDQSPWTDVNVAALVLATGMRPAAPVDCSTTVWLQGPSGSGKSWTASMMLSFHQAQKTWTEKQLPASLNDTETSVEQALSQSNVWVMDDLAPSPDKRSNDLALAKIGNIVRSVYNNSAKRRSGPDLKARGIFVPHALLVVTSENEHTIASVRDRTIMVDFGSGTHGSEDARENMVRFRDHGAPGRLLVAAVQAIQYQAGREGWAAMVEGLVGQPAVDSGVDDEPRLDGSFDGQYKKLAEKVISRFKSTGKANARHVEMAVDLMLGLAPLTILAELVGDREMSELLSPNRMDGLPGRVAAFAASSFRSQAETTPGAVLIEAIRNILAAGHAHIENAHDAACPPLPVDDPSGNRALGWQANGQGKLRPLGESIGTLKKTRGGDTDTIMLHATNAFARAQRFHPKALPAGTSTASGFDAFWNEGIIHPDHVKHREERRVDVKYNVGFQRRGVPIHINEILGAPIEVEET